MSPVLLIVNERCYLSQLFYLVDGLKENPSQLCIAFRLDFNDRNVLNTIGKGVLKIYSIRKN